jgi:hypothetical protein
MQWRALLNRYRESSELVKQLSVAGILLLAGLSVLPVLIFFAGEVLLGRYEGASLPGTFAAVFAGLRSGSIASWVVVLGPYLLFLLFKGLRAWWRASESLA